MPLYATLLTLAELAAALAYWSQILPKERVVDVSTTMVLDGRLQLHLFGNVIDRDCVSVGFLGCIESVNVDLMMLGVMQPHNLLAYSRLQSIVFVRERRQSLISCRDALVSAFRARA